MIGAKWFDLVVGVDIHWVLVPAGPALVPVPLPHPFAGLIFDPAGLIVGSIISGAFGAFKGITLTNKMPSAATGTEATNKILLPHFPMPPGVGWAMVPSAPLPPIPGKPLKVGTLGPIPSNDALIITGSKTVYIAGSNAARLGSMAMSCGEPVRLPLSTVIAIPMGPPVLIGGPPALDFMAAALSFIRSSWVSDRLHGILKAPPGSWRSKAICFLTGHPVDVASGKVITDHVDLELPGPIPFKLERSYYSGSEYDGPIGHDWGHSYDQFIYFEKNRIVFHEGEGREIYFSLIIAGEKTRNHFERMDLEWLSDRITITTKDNLKYHFCNIGRPDNRLYLKQITDYNDSTIRLSYNEQGYLYQITDSVGRKVGFVNDFNGKLVSINIPHPDVAGEQITVLRYEYSTDGDLIRAIDAHNNAFSYKYKYHLLVQETNRNGLSFYFAYDGIDKDACCVRTWGDNGIYDHVLTYDKQNHVTMVENSLGSITTYIMDSEMAVVKIVNPNGGETCFEYDDYSRKTSEKDALGNETKFEYDDLGNIKKTIDPDGTEIKVEYNIFNLPVEATDKIGGVWKWEYDKRLRICRRTDPLSRASHFVYTGKHLSCFIDPSGQKTYLSVDDMSNLRSITTPDGIRSHWKYDLLGRCTESIDPKGNSQKIQYDMLDNILQVNEPDSNIRNLIYDNECNVVSAKDNHYSFAFEYCGMNRMFARIQNNTRIEFNYNTEEQLTAITNEHGSVYSFELDSSGDVITESGFDEVRRIYRRDLGGQIVMTERPNGLFSEFSYDKMGRVTKIAYTDETEESFSYRKDGELIEAKNSIATVKFERNELGIILKEFQNDHWVESVYNKLDMRIQMQSSMGAFQTIDRNKMGDVDKITYGDKSQSADRKWETSFKRDEFGLEIERSLPGGVQSRWKRDKLGRPIEQSITAAKDYLRTRTYSWDVNDRLQYIKDSINGSTTFSHDAFGNLASARYENGAELFRMPDALGNLFRTTERKDRKYGKAGQLLEIYGPDGTTYYEYDPEGNLVKKTEPDGRAWSYQWNAADMMTSVTRPDGDEVTFAYDPLGRRVSKTYKGNTTKWVWDGNVMLHEWVENGLLEESHVNNTSPENTANIRNGQLQQQLTGRPAIGPPIYFNVESYNEASQRIQDEKNKTESEFGTREKPVTWLFEPESFAPIAKIVGEKHYSIITDHLGSPLAMFDQTGKNSWSMELDIFGQVRSLQGKREECPFRYPGQYEDTETGLYYNRFRYYDPEGGGYVSQDPIGLAGGNFNIYAYPCDVNSFTDVCGLYTFYQLFNSAGDVVYQGITDRAVQERLIEHARDGKVFEKVKFLDNLDNRIPARNLEGSALYHSHENSNILQNKKRLDGKYYHSYDPDNLKAGRTFLTQTEIDDLMKNATVADVDSKGKFTCQ
jgi:RHS repeat-associated protein